MANPIYPIRRSQSGTAQQSGDVALRYSTDTGAGNLYRNVGALSRTVFNIGIDTFVKQGDAENSILSLEAQESAIELMADIDREPDETKYAAKYKRWIEKQRAVEPKNGKAKQLYPKSLDSMEPIIQRQIAAKYKQRVDQRLADVMSVEKAKAVQLGTDTAWTNLQGQMANRVANGVISKAAAERHLVETRPRWERQKTENRRQQVINVIQADPKAAMKELEKSNEFTPGQKMEFRNLAISELNTQKRNAELLEDITISKGWSEIDNIVNAEFPSTQNTSSARAAISTMKQSDVKKIKTAAKLMEKTLNASKRPNPKTSAVSELDAFDALGNLISQESSLEEYAADLKTRRFNNEKLSQQSYLQMLGYGDIQIPPQIRDAVNAAIKSNKESFKGGRTLGPISPANEPSRDLNLKVNKALLDWLSSADFSPKTLPSEIKRVNDEIRAFAKSGEDPGDIKAAKEINEIMYNSDLPLDALKNINTAMSAGHSMQVILEEIKKDFPNVVK
ncbi:MAG: hypothetical protein GY941_21600 [Planctomycetes bacterium]|nr:hypothetical protein [Planctomycetota bacterium]